MSIATALVVISLVAVAGLTVDPPPSSATTVPGGVAGIQALYAQDLVARINAERAVRNSPGSPVPQVQVNAALAAYAQAWSAHLAGTGTVADPPLPPCNASGGAAQVCILAANSGDTGYGYWPGDGSDGMDAAYMNSAGHRENELGAGYTSVGVGVTCAGNQAWTVEVFGYAYGDYPSASARQAAQNHIQGQPVPASPQVAGVQTGDPVYCPGQMVGPNHLISATGGQFAYPYSVPGVPGEPSADTVSPVVGLAAVPDGSGYWVVRSDGAVTAHGSAGNFGSMAGRPLSAPIAHVVATPDGKGYWLVASDGGIFAFGDAAFYGSMGGRPLNASVVGLAADPASGGYWLVAADGGIFAFGAPFKGSTGNIRLNQPVNGMAPTSSGAGYWFVAADGGIFAFGQARFFGSTGAFHLNAPIVGMANDPATGGYWLVAADGGVFAFNAPFYGAG